MDNENTNDVIETVEPMTDDNIKIDALTETVKELTNTVNELTKSNNELKVLNEKLTLRVSTGAVVETPNDGVLFGIFDKYNIN